jgi:RNA polymerase sigma-70 factor (ECF subfamily)
MQKPAGHAARLAHTTTQGIRHFPPEPKSVKRTSRQGPCDVDEYGGSVARADATPESAPGDFTQVVEEHWDSVYRLLSRLTGRQHDADELAQETFLRALASWKSFTAGTNVRAWLLRIASNLFLDETRRRKRRPEAVVIEEPAGPAKDPGADLETREQAALARALLAELGETTRLVFHLRVTEEMSFRDIGQAAGISEEAARWHMHQARTKLVERMRDEGEKRS